jgi:hypothetical protein
MMGMTNQRGPNGSLTYNERNKPYKMTIAGQTYEIPRFNAVTELSGRQQKLQNTQNRAGQNMAELAAQQSRKLGNILGTPMKLGNAPKVKAPNLQKVNAAAKMGRVGDGPKLATAIAGAGPLQRSVADGGDITGTIADAGKINRSIANAGNITGTIADAGNINRSIAGAGDITRSIADAGNITRNIADAGDITRNIANAGDITNTYGTDFSEDRRRVEEALMSRINPSLQQDRSSLEASLANKGIAMGSAAYDRAMDETNRTGVDARMQAILAGGQEQSRMVGMERDRSVFQNDAQSQQYSQNANDAAFTNSAQAQQYGQNANNAQFTNAAQAQQYGQNANNAAFANLAQGQQWDQNAQQAAFGNASQAQQYGQNANNAQFANAAQAQRWGQNSEQAAFGNAAQAQQYGQNANNAQFSNQAALDRFGRNLAQGQFANAAQGQQFGQNAQQAAFGNAAKQGMYDNKFNAQGFNNDASQQNFSNQMARVGFNNDTRQQGFGNAQSMRGNYLNEQYAKRNQPINEIGALLGTGQVQQPQFAQTPGGNMATTDYAGLVQSNYNGQLGQYQAQQANSPWNGIMGGLFGLGSASILASDRRLKRDVSFLGFWRDLPIYAYRYIWGGPRQVGVMAQDMLRLRPAAVVPVGDFLAVDYGRL